MKKLIAFRIFLNVCLAFVMVGSVFAVPHFVRADATTTDLTINLDNPISADTFQEFISSVMTGVVELMTPVIILMFIWTGFLFVQAQGNGEKLDVAKKSLMYTIIGAALVLGAEGLSKVLESTLTGL